MDNSLLESTQLHLETFKDYIYYDLCPDNVDEDVFNVIFAQNMAEFLQSIRVDLHHAKINIEESNIKDE